MTDETPLSLRRITWGWTALTLLFAFLVFRSLTNYFAADQSKGPAGFNSAATELKSSMALKGVLSGVGTSSGDLDSVAKQVQPSVSKDNEAAALMLAVNRELGQQPSPTALARLRKGKAASQAIATIYAAKKLSRPDADALIAKLPKDNPVTEIVAVHAREAAGVTDARKGLLPTTNLIIAAVLGGGALMLGFGVAMGLVLSKATGSLHFAGHPIQPLDDPRADRLAIRAFQMVCIFLGLNLVLLPVAMTGGMSAYGIVLTVVMITATVFLFRTPIAGQTISLRDIGVTTDHLGRDILIGLTGYLANLPLLIIAVAVGSILMRFLPASHHPVTEMLMERQNPIVLVALFLQASVMAPFWEEICFRGLLFPAFSHRWSSVILGGFTSSLLFASIHPQGIPLWLGLGMIGAMSCGLAQYSKSLIPSMVMHAVHNGATLALVLLVTR